MTTLKSWGKEQVTLFGYLCNARLHAIYFSLFTPHDPDCPPWSQMKGKFPVHSEKLEDREAECSRMESQRLFLPTYNLFEY